MSAVPIQATPDDRFPLGFPRAPKACSTVAQAFFTCLDTNTTKTSPSDTEATNRALKACLSEKKVYEKCMIEYETKNPPKRYRVQDEYKVEAQKA